MKQVNSFRYWLTVVLLLCVGMTAKAYDLTLTEGATEHGTVAFKINSGAATPAPATANENDKVTIEITPAGKGWQVDKVTATAYTSWGTAAARAMLPEELPTVKVVAVSGEKYTYEIAKMPHNNVQIDVTYKKTSMDDVTIADIPDQTYTGSEIKPALTVTFGDVTLVENTDFTIVKWENNVDVSTDAKPAKVTIKGIEAAGFEASEKNKNFKIVAKNLNSQDITVDPIPDQVYTGSQITPAVVVKDGEKELEKDKDYTVSYGENINAGKDAGKVTITGIGNYTDELKPTFDITKADAKATKDPEAKTGLVYNGDKQELVTGGTAEGGKIQYSTDGGDTWKDDIPTGTNAGSYDIYWKVTGDENHNDTEKKKLYGKIAKAPLKSITVDPTSYSYDGETKTPTVTVKATLKDGDKVLTKGTDYTLTGNTGKDAGPYNAIATGKGNFEGKLEAPWTINKADISDETLYTVTLSPTTYVFDGTDKTPTVTVIRKKDNKKLTLNSDFKVTYANNRNVGTATATVEGIGTNYQGTKVLEFTITKSDSPVEITPTEWSTTFGVGAQSFKVEITKPSPAPEVQFITGNSEVATVDAEGNVTVTGAGVTTIYALVLGDNNYVSSWAACEVTVKPQEIENANVTVGDTGANGVSVITAKNKAGQTLIEGTDYEIEYVDADEQTKTIDEMRQAPGKYTAVLTFGGNYQGIVKKEITVEAGLMDSDDFIDALLDGTIKTGAVDETNAQYDVNGDGQVDIADLQALMNLEVGLNIDGSKPGEARATVNAGVAVLNVSSADMGGGVTRYTLSLEQGREFSAFMMDVVTGGMVIGEQADGMQLRSSTLDGMHRIIGLAEGAAEGNVLRIDVMGNGSVSFRNISFSTPGATAFYVRMGDATGISLTSATTAGGDVFGLGGQRQDGLQKGVNIVRDRNGKAVKVFRK